MADAQIGGGNPGVFHVTNVALHVLNALLLFAFLRIATSFDGLRMSRWRSAAVAALFAIHPLHVESVAWVTERKDLLFAFPPVDLAAINAQERHYPAVARKSATTVASATGRAARSASRRRA